jgi:hypothetical protein
MAPCYIAYIYNAERIRSECLNWTPCIGVARGERILRADLPRTLPKKKSKVQPRRPYLVAQLAGARGDTRASGGSLMPGFLNPVSATAHEQHITKSGAALPSKSPRCSNFGIRENQQIFRTKTRAECAGPLSTRNFLQNRTGDVQFVAMPPLPSQ